ncbi:MAG: DUF1330 domain-containing protein [Hyphomicrobiales bacterium]|nr:DUF1330 domain-containing protein [Hyphomicrobiales bacterium]
MKVVNSVFPNADQLKHFMTAAEDGPFVMVNLLKFKPKAEYADGSDADLSGAAAYARYGVEVAKLLAKQGGRIVYSGAVTNLMVGECDPSWDAVALAEYPSFADFRAMVTSSEYQAIEKHRLAGLAGQLNIRTKGASGG